MPNNDPTRAPRHPIRVVSERTGLSVDVLRAWQKRYGAVQPGRSDAGQRLYSDADIERLRLIAEAVRGGRSVAQVAQLASEQLVALLREDKANTRPRPDDVERTIDHCFYLTGQLDEVQLELQLRRALMQFGAETFLEEVVPPLLTRIGEAWASGQLTPAHEHLASAVTRRVLEWIIASAESGDDAPLIMLTTTSGDLHELGALLAATVAALEGWRIRYLGPNLPASHLARAARQAEARAVAVSAVHKENGDPGAYFTELAGELNGTPVFAGGPALSKVKLSGARVFRDLRAFRTELAVLRASVST